MGALSFFTTLFAPSRSQVEIDSRRCLRNRMHGNKCDLCLQICPTTALSYSEGSLHFAEENCNNCLGCTAVCPVDALVPSSNLEHLIHQAKRIKQTKLVISCEYNRLFRDDELLVPCLGAFSHELLLSLSSALLEKTVFFNIRTCGSCSNQNVSRFFQRNLKSIVRYSDNSSSPTKMELISADSNQQIQNDRRSFFKAVRHDAVSATIASQTRRIEQRPPATSRVISSKTALLKNVLESNDPPHPLASRMVPQLHISEQCTPCPRCSGICPTGALKLIRQEQAKKVVYDGTSCCSCALCVDFCKEEALALSCTLKV